MCSRVALRHEISRRSEILARMLELCRRASLTIASGRGVIENIFAVVSLAGC